MRGTFRLCLAGKCLYRVWRAFLQNAYSALNNCSRSAHLDMIVVDLRDCLGQVL